MAVSSSILGFTGAIVLVYILVFVVSFLSNLFLCLTVVKDCETLRIRNKAMWGVLVFFFPLVAGIVYLCMRKNLAEDNFCTTCGKPLKHNLRMCDNCGSAAISPIPLDENMQTSKRKRKSFFITWIVMLCLSVIISIVMCVVAIVGSAGIISSLGDDDNYYSDDDTYSYYYDSNDNDFDFDESNYNSDHVSSHNSGHISSHSSTHTDTHHTDNNCNY